jgi:arylsulfatase A-like enzyme
MQGRVRGLARGILTFTLATGCAPAEGPPVDDPTVDGPRDSDPAHTDPGDTEPADSDPPDTAPADSDPFADTDTASPSDTDPADTDPPDTDPPDDSDLPPDTDPPDLPPTIDAAVLDPPAPRVGDPVTCAAVGVVDPDGDDVTLAFAWELDGAPLGTGPTVRVPDAIGAVLRCRVTPSDGTGPGDAASAEATVAPLAPGNVLLLVLDDVGLDRLSAYGVGTPAPPTPRLDALAAEGVRFDHAWSTPVCQPARASILTGKLPFRHGFGEVDRVDATWVLQPTDLDLPEALAAYAPTPYATAALGKWHLAGLDDGWARHPLDRGFDRYRGQPGNLEASASTDGRSMGYFDYEYFDDTGLRRRQDYLTTVEADDAVAAMAELPEPWLVYVGFHAVHLPGQLPPADLWSGVTLPGAGTTQQKADAMMEALDHEVGRVLDAAPPDTTVIVVGDNGTPRFFATHGPYPTDRVKQTIYEGGVNVPLIVTGPLVATPGAVSHALVHVTDLFPTVLALGGVDPAALPTDVGTDGQSLVPYLLDPDAPSRRSVVYTERFAPNGLTEPLTDHQRAVRDEHHKLLRFFDGHEELYDLRGEVQETSDLLPTADADTLEIRDRLAGWLDGPTFRR